MDIFGTKKNKNRIDKLDLLNKELQAKTSVLTNENQKVNSLLSSVFANYENFNGETSLGELGDPKEIIIDYENLRVRAWEFGLKNHLANQIATKRVNWTIGKGLLFNCKPLEKPFLDYYKNAKKAKEAQSKFIKDSEYLFRSYAKTTLCDYAGKKNLHEIARQVDFNAIHDGDILLVSRIKNLLPNIQAISGQVVTNPIFSENEVKGNNSVYEGVEFDKKGKTVAFHVLKNTDTTNGQVLTKDFNFEFGTKRIKAFFPNTKLNSAWLYMQSDLQKFGETRSMPLLSHVFEALKHLNDFLIANAKNAQLLSQIAIVLERDSSSDGERIFNNVSMPGQSTDIPSSSVANDLELAEYAAKAEFKLEGNGQMLELPVGVKAKIMNPQAQSNQEEYLKSTLQTIASATGFPYEVLISSYNSNYTASMGARSDFQFNLDTLTEVVPANQFYRKIWNLFIYTHILSGKIECAPLLKAYNENDEITIQALTNSSFEGTKIKPIDPLKFVKALRAQLPESVREDIPLNTIENIVNMVSNNDYEGVLTQVMNEVDLIPEKLKKEEKAAK